MANVTLMFAFTASNQFQPLTGSSPQQGLCTPAIALIDGQGEVTISGDMLPYKVNSGGKLFDAYPTALSTSGNPTVLTVLSGKQPTFQFTVSNVVSGLAGNFYLGGIALKSVPSTSGGTSTAGEAGDVFDAITVDVDPSTGATTLKVHDNNPKAATSKTYEFWVMVQNPSGDVGLIDPRIVNSSN